MLKEISNKLEIKKAEPFDLYIEKNLKDRIDEYWKDFTKDKPDYYNSEVLSVQNFDYEKSVMMVQKTRFSNVFYSAKNGELKTNNLFTAILFKTLDDYYVVISNTYDSRINIIGGFVEIKDFEGDKLDYFKALKRETLEEIGIDLENKNQVLSYDLKYIKMPPQDFDGVFYPYGICYTGILNYTSEDFKEYINKNISHFDGELKELLCLTKEECLNLEVKKGDREYIKEFLELEIKN